MNLVALPVLIPLIAGTAQLALGKRMRTRQVIGIASAAMSLLVSVVLLIQAGIQGEGQALRLIIGGWPAPQGIELAADALGALMLLLSSFTALLTTIALSAAPPEREGEPVLLQLLFAGVNLAFVTADLFNLFVAFEILLVASYALVSLGGKNNQVREGFRYLVMNLLASSLFVVSCGIVYGLIGTLNLADLAGRVQELGPSPALTALVVLLAFVFATKSALVPLGFWLPDTYPTLSPEINAYFGAILTKIGIYGLARLLSVFAPFAEPVRDLLLVAAGLTMVVGSLGALSRARWREVLAFSGITQVGYLAFGLGLGGEVALTAVAFYLIHHVLVKFALFSTAGLVERTFGQEYFLIGGVLEVRPLYAAIFLPLALGLSGLPPTSGFLGKLALVQAGIARGDALALTITAIAILAGLASLYTMLSIWRGVFWGRTPLAAKPLHVPRRVLTVALIATVASLSVVPFAEPIYRYATRVAAELEAPRTLSADHKGTR